MYPFFKRSFCIVLSFLGIIITSPFWIIAMIGILISDFGPVFYKANRIGKDNKPFRMLKFRSMKIAKDSNEMSFKADPNRIFPFGAFIRATKIDELPQLLNCLIGEMAIIGPRPAANDQFNVVRAGRYVLASKVRPGLSGPAALYDYLYGDTINDEIEYEKTVLPTRLDLEVYYVKHMSIGYDLRIIWWTIVCIIFGLFRKTPKYIYNRLLYSASEDQ